MRILQRLLFGVFCVALTTLGSATRLNNPNTATGVSFGRAVASHVDRLLIGAPRAGGAPTNQSGTAHLFNLTLSTFTLELRPTTTTLPTNFGAAVALSSAGAFVGAPRDSETTTLQGLVHQFNANTGALIRILASPNPLPFERFGASVATAGNLVAVGAPEELFLTTSDGMVYVFNANTGALVQSIAPPPNSQRFGASVAFLSDGTLAVGDPAYDPTGSDPNTGRILQYNPNTGALLWTSDAGETSGVLLGSSLSAAGSFLLGGAPGSPQTTGTGVARLYNPAASTTPVVSYPATEAADTDAGVAVAGNGDFVYVGVPKVAGGPSALGRVQSFDRPAGTGLASYSDAPGAQTGSSAVVVAGILAAGAPAFNDSEGAVVLFDVPCPTVTAPTVFVPAAGALVPCDSVTQLSWDAVANATTYTVYLDGNPVGTTTDNFLNFASPLNGSRNWYVVAGNNCTEATGPVLNFCTPVSPASNPVPADGSAAPPETWQLQWQGNCGANAFDVYFNGSLLGTTTNQSIALTSTPLGAGEYNWQVVSYNGCDVTTGPLWNFGVCRDISSTTITQISPFCGETTRADVITLDWSDVPGATTYTIRLNGLLLPPVTVSQQVVTSQSLIIGFNAWEVFAANGCTTISSDICLFEYCADTTAAILLSPACSETTAASLLRFDWSDAVNADQYNLFIDGIFVAQTVNSEYTLPAPLAPGSHEWFIQSINGCTAPVSTTCSFCLVTVPQLLQPADGDFLCQSPPILDWNGFAGDEFDVYIDSVLVATTTDTQYVLPGVLPNGDHTWQIVARNSCGSLPSERYDFRIGTGADPNAAVWRTNGQVYAMAAVGTTLYIGGNFTKVGPAATAGTQAGWLTRNNVAAIDLDSSGTANSWNPNVDFTVYAIEPTSATIFLGGDFDFVGGVPRQRLAEVDQINGALTLFNAPRPGRVRAIELVGNKLYVGGEVDTSSTGQLAEIDATNSTVNATWLPAPGYHVYDIEERNNKLYVAGAFHSIAGQLRRGLVRFDLPSLGLDTAWTPACDNYVYSLTFKDDSLMYVGGNFTQIGGALRRNIAALNVATATATLWNPFSNGAVNAVAIAGNSIYAGGFFSFIGSQPRAHLAVLDGSTGLANQCDFNPDNVVRSIVVTNRGIWVAGDFTYCGITYAQGLVYFGSGFSGAAARVADWLGYSPSR